ncbi:hypothetical protein P3T18_006807 [Paraburkholderia sp. GAS199]|uniref:hypothetical protein n=1 Tax=Paraburkholderia sp. GAS199 TaxID=3035126 RepID=UPI003D1C4D9E
MEMGGIAGGVAAGERHRIHESGANAGDRACGARVERAGGIECRDYRAIVKSETGGHADYKTGNIFMRAALPLFARKID